MTVSVTEDIKTRLDIVEVIAEYVELKKAGINYKALCPFHAEKTPSFMVNPQKQIYHCFGCGAGGDMFGFVMQYEKVSFPEALASLAKKAGVALKPSRGKRQGTETEVLYRLHEEATEFYAAQLGASPAAQAFFAKRGIGADSLHAFRLGYAPQGPDALYRFLRGKGYHDGIIETAGVVRFPENRKPYDMFRDRIIFPIADAAGKVIAFGARVLASGADQKTPKYINSPETPVFRKGQTLYALDRSREWIRKKNYAIIAEGYTDVIMFHQYGFSNAVAPLGTALTEGHIRKLRAYSRKALLVFDGDDAGIRAARRSFPILCQHGMRGKVLLLPEGSDPDSFLREKGALELQKMFPGARDIVEFYLDLREDRVEIVRELMEIAATMQDAIARGQLVTDIARKTGIPDVYLVEEIGKIMKPERREKADGPAEGSPSPEDLLLAVAFARPDHAAAIIARLDEKDFEREPARRIFLKIREMESVPPLDRISAAFDGDEVSWITALVMRSGFDEESVEHMIDDCFRKMRVRALRKNVADMELRIRIAESSGDQAVVDTLLSRKQAVLEEARNEGIL